MIPMTQFLYPMIFIYRRLYLEKFMNFMIKYVDIYLNKSIHIRERGYLNDNDRD